MRAACRTASALLIWLTGMLLALLPPVIGLALAVREVRRCPPATDPALLRLTSDLGRQLGCTRPISLRRGRSVTMPVTQGLLRPVILLPADAGEWPAERLRVVLLHEIAHVQRGDWATQVFARLLCAVYWHNPLVWLAARRLRAEGEQASDDRALSAGGVAPAEYAHHLLALARALHGSRAPLAVPLAQSGALENRLRAILAGTRPRHALTRRRVALAVLTTLIVVAPLAAVRPAARAVHPAHQRPFLTGPLPISPHIARRHPTPSTRTLPSEGPSRAPVFRVASLQRAGIGPLSLLRPTGVPAMTPKIAQIAPAAVLASLALGPAVRAVVAQTTPTAPVAAPPAVTAAPTAQTTVTPPAVTASVIASPTGPDKVVQPQVSTTPVPAAPQVRWTVTPPIHIVPRINNTIKVGVTGFIAGADTYGVRLYSAPWTTLNAYRGPQAVTAPNDLYQVRNLQATGDDSMLPKARVTLKLDNTPIREALNTLFSAAHASYTVAAQVPDTDKVTIHVENVPFAAALRALLAASDAPLSYTVREGGIIAVTQGNPLTALLGSYGTPSGNFTGQFQTWLNQMQQGHTFSLRYPNLPKGQNLAVPGQFFGDLTGPRPKPQNKEAAPSKPGSQPKTQP